MNPHHAYQLLNQLDYSHPWVTAPDHIFDIWQYAKDYAGETALEIGSFQGHGACALSMANLRVKSCDPDPSHLFVRQQLCPQVTFSLTTGAEELVDSTQYAVVFHDSYHGERVVPELLDYWHKKITPGGLLIVHDTDQLQLGNFLDKLGKPPYRVTFDQRKRGLGFFWRPY
jgi:hypothetical protein